ncbi:putative swi snf complex subunit snf59 protein [Botrytis cinerea BcDW1]|uniref:Putative swi snf complex subunit snf59 protein n=1 Tax=Botryotinia fuckeliana (strain BcDW1) TaxID=1290391 RepID=M7UMA5_BOTF1|nr:putative swi snf complex subunit snf59 protein [Botrytis cinerea BcDW1]
MANGTVDKKATLGKPNDDLSSEVPPSNDVEKPDTPSSSSTNSPPKKDYNDFDTEKVKRYTCPYCKDTYITTRESMSHIAPVDMEQEEVLKCPHCAAPSIRETLEFTEEIIEARPRRSYIPVFTGKKRFCCPHCKRASNTTLEAMLTLIPEITDQGELRTCLYCRKPSLKTTLESYSDMMLHESSHIPIQPNKSSSSNSDIEPPRQPPPPNQASTGTTSSQNSKGTIHTPAFQNLPDQQININPRLAIQRNNDQYPISQTTLNQQAAFQPSSDEQPASDSNSHKQSTFQPDFYRQQPTFNLNSYKQSTFQSNFYQQQQPAFNSNSHKQSTFQPDFYRQQPTFNLNSHKQSTFQSNFYQQQQPAFNSNSHKQSTFQPDFYQQQQPAVHHNSNQQSTPGINTGLELASNRSSQIGPRMSPTCRYCGKRFTDDATHSKHDLTCRYRLWFFCPEPNCRFHRDKEVGFQISTDLWVHVSEQHNYSPNSQFFLTYRGEVRDPGRIGVWRAP